MLKNLKEIYQDQIVENVIDYNYNEYYYFYNNDNTVFGISKKISNKEYKLIQTSFIEKKIYNNNEVKQNIYEYLFENKAYPFSKKKYKIIIIDNDNKEIEEVLTGLYKEVNIIYVSGTLVAFCNEDIKIELQNFANALSDDLGFSFKIHEGIYINPTISGSDVLSYISEIKNFMLMSKENYSDFATPLINVSVDRENYRKLIYNCSLKNVLEDAFTKDIILTYFKNDLNVSQTAKDLYLNRNSLLNKFDNIEANTGFNMQKFEHACAIYLFLMLGN